MNGGRDFLRFQAQADAEEDEQQGEDAERDGIAFHTELSLRLVTVAGAFAVAAARRVR
jgi:hypothetical protein